MNSSIPVGLRKKFTVRKLEDGTWDFPDEVVDAAKALFTAETGIENPVVTFEEKDGMVKLVVEESGAGAT